MSTDKIVNKHGALLHPSRVLRCPSRFIVLKFTRVLSRSSPSVILKKVRPNTGVEPFRSFSVQCKSEKESSACRANTDMVGSIFGAEWSFRCELPLPSVPSYIGIVLSTSNSACSDHNGYKFCGKFIK